MTNFVYFKSEAQFYSFVDVAMSAEKIIHLDPEASIINCRRSMEFAIKWMYSVDKSLIMPYQDNLISLMHTDEFKDIVDDNLWRRLDFIRRMGNNAAHTGKKVTFDQATLCLQNLFIFVDFIAYCYADEYEHKEFNLQLIIDEANNVTEKVKASEEFADIDFKALMAENKALKEELTNRRESQAPEYVPKPLDLSEYKTRKIYIDSMLMDAGWIEGKDWINEVELPGMNQK